MKIEQMFVLMDGSQADPYDCARDKAGVLRHKNGVRVAIDGDGEPERVGDRTAMNSLAAGRRDDEQQPRPKVERQPPSGEVPKADGDKPADPEIIPSVAGGAVEGEQQAPGSEKPQE